MDEKDSPPKTSRPKTRRPAPAAGREAAPFTAELEATLSNPPSEAAHEPAAPPERTADSAGQTGTPDTEPPRQLPFDRIVDYREDLAADFDAITSEHPRYAVLGALALGIGIGFVAGLLLARE